MSDEVMAALVGGAVQAVIGGATVVAMIWIGRGQMKQAKDELKLQADEAKGEAKLEQEKLGQKWDALAENKLQFERTEETELKKIALQIEGLKQSQKHLENSLDAYARQPYVQASLEHRFRTLTHSDNQFRRLVRCAVAMPLFHWTQPGEEKAKLLLEAYRETMEAVTQAALFLTDVEVTEMTNFAVDAFVYGLKQNNIAQDIPIDRPPISTADFMNRSGAVFSAFRTRINPEGLEKLAEFAVSKPTIAGQSETVAPTLRTEQPPGTTGPAR